MGLNVLHLLAMLMHEFVEVVLSGTTNCDMLLWSLERLVSLDRG